jgi:hypothetical protein
MPDKLSGDLALRALLHLALTLALFVPGAAAAQSTADQMLAMAKQIRASAEQLKDSLSAEDRAQMISQAEEIEKAVRDGAYAGAAPQKAPDLAERILAAHGGRLEWLTSTGACSGYTQENYLTWRHSAPDRTELDQHCKNAYGHWATYIRVTRNGEGRDASETALEYYDAAARRAVDYAGRKR